MSESDRNGSTETPAQPDPPAPERTSRRRFVGGGLAGGLVLTVSARPVWANHCTASGMYSGNLSRPHGTTCGGCSPAVWFAAVANGAAYNWPDAFYVGTWDANKGHYKDDGTKFHAEEVGFIKGSGKLDGYKIDLKGDSMYKVLRKSVDEGKTDYDLAAQAVAALLNAVYGYHAAMDSTGDPDDSWYGVMPDQVRGYWNAMLYGEMTAANLMDLLVFLNDSPDIRPCDIAFS